MDGKCRNPVEVSRENAVLVGGSGPTHQFERAQIRGEETESGHPCRHLAAGHEEIVRSVRIAPEVNSDSQHHDEVNHDDQYIHRDKESESCVLCRFNCQGQDPNCQ